VPVVENENYQNHEDINNNHYLIYYTNTRFRVIFFIHHIYIVWFWTIVAMDLAVQTFPVLIYMYIGLTKDIDYE